jgi:hypothetical protein
MEWIHHVPQHHAVVVKQGTEVVGVGGVVGAFYHLAKIFDAFFILVQRVDFEVFLKTSIIC